MFDLVENPWQGWLDKEVHGFEAIMEQGFNEGRSEQRNKDRKDVVEDLRRRAKILWENIYIDPIVPAAIAKTKIEAIADEYEAAPVARKEVIEDQAIEGVAFEEGLPPH